jgi:hypothetical protein
MSCINFNRIGAIYTHNRIRRVLLGQNYWVSDFFNRLVF